MSYNAVYKVLFFLLSLWCNPGEILKSMPHIVDVIPVKNCRIQDFDTQKEYPINFYYILQRIVVPFCEPPMNNMT